MNPTLTPNDGAPEPGEVPSTPDSTVEIRLLTDADDMVIIGEVFQTGLGLDD